MSWPAYLETHARGELARRVERAVAVLASCTVCPRDCRVDRLRDEAKVCRVGRRAKVASFFAHFGEEDCLRGFRGSGTIFFSWCNLKCVFCQNWDTSNEGAGREVSADALAAMMLELQATTADAHLSAMAVAHEARLASLQEELMMDAILGM